MIHRAPFGSMERFVAVLLEHTAGRFPLWLAPEQVIILVVVKFQGLENVEDNVHHFQELVFDLR